MTTVTVMHWIAVVAASVGGVAAGFFLGWIAAGGRCGLGLHDWRVDTDLQDTGIHSVVEYCYRCGLHREHHFTSSDR